MEPFGRVKEELDAYMFRLEEAKKRDHRKLGNELGLFMFHDYALCSILAAKRRAHLR